MSMKYRGFTVSFNAIGAGRIPRQYLVLACQDMLGPLLATANRNMVEAKCSCQIIITTRCVFRQGSMGRWVKYQLVMVVAPNHAKHIQAKKLMESMLPGNMVLQEYNGTAKTRLQCHEFVPDNKKLVFGFHRNGMTNYQFGEVDDLDSPAAPLVNKTTGAKEVTQWMITKRERRGVYVPGHQYPLHRRLDMLGLLDMLLLNVDAKPKDPETNASNKEGRNRIHGYLDNPANYMNDRKFSLTSPPPAFGLV